MGLDLYHKKAVEEPVDEADYLALEYFSHEALEAYGFSRFVRNIPTIRVVHTARFFDSLAAYNWAKSRHAQSGYDERATYFLGSPEESEPTLLDLESRLGLERSRARILTGRWSDNGVQYREQTLSYLEPATEKGIYFVEAGYQRKGMSHRFYDDYSGNKVYVERERFANLPSYLWEDTPASDRQNLFDRFISNYEHGRSMLYASM